MWELDQCLARNNNKRRKASRLYRNLILKMELYKLEKMVVNISSHSMLYLGKSQIKNKYLMMLLVLLWTLCLKDSTAPFLHMVKLVLVKRIQWLVNTRILKCEVSFHELSNKYLIDKLKRLKNIHMRSVCHSFRYILKWYRISLILITLKLEYEKTQAQEYLLAVCCGYLSNQLVKPCKCLRLVSDIDPPHSQSLMHIHQGHMLCLW